MKYIKKFDTTTLYNNATLNLPNVSLTMDDREVHYNPYDERLITKYNVTNTSSPTVLLESSSNISAIEIDGTALNSVVTSYTFSTTGVHTVKYTLTDNTSIGNDTFASCYDLTGVTIPNTVTSIGLFGFSHCSGLTSVEIPDSVTSIGNEAFSSCYHITTLIVQATTPPTLGTYALDDTSTNLIIKVPSASVNAYKAAFNWSAYASKIQAI